MTGQLTWLELETSPCCQFTAVVALLAPRLEHAELRGRVGQAAVDQLTKFGSDRLARLHLRDLAPGVQLRHLSALAGLRTLSLGFGCNEAGRPGTRDPLTYALCDCSQLVELSLTFPGLRVLPDSLTRLTALRRLSVSAGSWLPQSHRRHLVVEAGLGQLRSLVALGIRYCVVPREWPSLGGLTVLAELEFGDCTFAGGSLPASCAAAPALTRLICRSVRGCGLGSLSRLASLTLEDCELHELPAAVCELRGLTSLVLSHNPLHSLPRAISRLASLEVLDLSGRNPFMRRLVEDEEGELGLSSVFLPVELACLSRLELLILTNLSFRLEAGLCGGLADLPSLECVALRGALQEQCAGAGHAGRAPASTGAPECAAVVTEVL